MMAPDIYRERIKFDVLLRQIRTAIGELDRLSTRGVVEAVGSSEWASSLAGGLLVTLRAMESSLGECRKESPYSTLHPVIDEDGSFRWCCNHETEHCS
jgi:hypothetical protein